MHVVVKPRNGCDLITVYQGKNSLTVNLMDWYEALIGKDQLEYFPPCAEVMAGTSDNIFAKQLQGPLVPLYDKTDEQDFRDNARTRKELNPYVTPVIMGNSRRDPKSWPIYADSFISGV